MNGAGGQLRHAGAALFAACLVSAGPAGALIRNDLGTGSPGSYPATVAVNTPGGLCSGTVVGDGWYVLTAAHCTGAGDPGNLYSIQNALGQSTGGNGMLGVIEHPTLDMALIPLSTQFGAFVELYTGIVALGDDLTFVGVGTSANALNTGTYNLPGGTFRQGMNEVETLGASTVGFYWDNPGLGAAEALSAPGDSGMGYMVTINGTNYLVGVHIGRIGAENTYGSQSVGTIVAQGNNGSIYNWVLENSASVPEPATLGMVTLGLFGIFYARRQVRRDRLTAGLTSRPR